MARLALALSCHFYTPLHTPYTSVTCLLHVRTRNRILVLYSSLQFSGLHFFDVPVVACCCAQFFFDGLVKACFCAFFQAFIRPCIAITSHGSTTTSYWYHSKVVYFGQTSVSTKLSFLHPLHTPLHIGNLSSTRSYSYQDTSTVLEFIFLQFTFFPYQDTSTVTVLEFIFLRFYNLILCKQLFFMHFFRPS